MTQRRPTAHRPDHPLAPPSGLVRVARMVLYEKLGPEPRMCHWCGEVLDWTVASGVGICVDHVDGDTENNDPDNLVPSCRGCNANRDRGGRPMPRLCDDEDCGVKFKPRRRTSRFCSIACASRNRPERPVTSAHGTRARYTSSDKCRCDECRAANAAYTQKLIQDRAERGDDARPCEHCGTVFAPPRRRARFCTKTCARRAGC